MINGSGSLITEVDEEGNPIEFLSTEEILKQLMKFGFYITYDVKTNLPEPTLAFLYKVMNLGFDKITRVARETRDVSGNRIWRPTVIVMKSEFNTDLLVFDCKVTSTVFNAKLLANSIMNVTDESNIDWRWLAYMANISEILEENDYPPEPESESEPGGD